MLVGREAERSAIGALLEAARDSRSGALVVRGEPGIGKTALLEDTRQRAPDMHVLRARGVESESDLPFAALDQLLRPALGHLEELPPAQASALRAALGLEAGPADERYLVFVACLSLLSELAEQRPVLCLVDDAHWLDSASADALLFVARRLDAEGIVILFAAREGEVRRLEATSVPSLTLGALDDEAASMLLSRAAGSASEGVRARLVEHARGNALALVELPSALSAAQLAGQEPLPEALPVTQEVGNVFLERVRRLPDDAQRLLLLAAADGSGDAGLVARAAALVGIGSRAPDAAEEVGLVSVRGSLLEFRHPLVRSAVYEAAPSSARRAAHRALASALADDPAEADRRAWHLAASALEPDAEVVVELEEAAARAEERGGHLAAARALERAAELTTDPARRGVQLTRAAWVASLAGRDARAVGLADRATPLAQDPMLRVRLAEVRGLAAIRSGRPGDAVAVLVDAARASAADEPATALELLMLASSAAWQGGDRSAYLDVARLARDVVAPPGDERSTLIGRALSGYAAMIEGDTSTGLALLEETVVWGARTEEPLLAYWAGWGALWLGDEKRFGELVIRAAELARSRGEIGTLAYALGARAAQLALAQRYDDALVAATEAVEFARELGATNLELIPRGAIAIVAAVRGDDDEAKQHGEETLAIAETNGLLLRASFAVYALALLDLGRARWSQAFDRLDSLVSREPGTLDPAVAVMLPDAIEAAIRAGRRDRAEATLVLLEDWARHAPETALPRLASCRALLSDGEEATGHFEEAIRRSHLARPFDLARVQLLYGEHLRRNRNRADSRPLLRAAYEGFERLRAEPWSERASRELQASGETARKRDPSTIDQLTPRERQIARCAADGLTNKAIAAQLFLSPRTVEYHLRHAFTKLGVTTRTQLARLPLADDDDVSQGSYEHVHG